MAVTPVFLGLYAVGAVLAAPFLLSRRRWIIRHPRLALTAWIGLFLSGVLSGLLGLVWWVIVSANGDPAHGNPTTGALFIGSWLLVAMASGSLVAMATRASALIGEHRRHDDDLRAVLGLCADRESTIAGTAVRLVTSQRPFAVGVPGRRPVVVLSTSLIDLLDPAQTRAVVHHELAHLQQRHGALLRLAHLHQACVPFLRASTDMRDAFALLIELIADDVSAKRCGSTALSGALATLSAATNEPSMSLRAKRLVDLAA